MGVRLHRLTVRDFVGEQVQEVFHMTQTGTDGDYVLFQIPMAEMEDLADFLIERGSDAARDGKKAAGKRTCADGDAIRDGVW
jgi:hypothetical protein